MTLRKWSYLSVALMRHIQLQIKVVTIPWTDELSALVDPEYVHCHMV